MSGLFHFAGGIHPKELRGGKAATADCGIVATPLPSRVAIPLQQHSVGAPCKALVQKGDHVLVGQKIGEPVGVMSAAVHASISGIVVDVQSALVAGGQRIPCVIIDNDFKDEWVSLYPVAKPLQMKKEELSAAAREMGIVGLGGATFPTAVKLNIPSDKKIDTLILNGSECEPYLSADHRLMLEYAKEILSGAELIRKVLGIEKIIVAIENNKRNAIEAMRAEAKNYEKCKIVSLRTRYPQGGEKQLVYALTGRVIRMGGLPLDVGAVVCNVATVYALYRAVYEGRPLIDRVVTVGGLVERPANYLVRIGTPVELLLDTSGEMLPEAKMLIYGGPMMGKAISRQDIPITKGCSGILAMAKSDSLLPETACIRCGRCMNVCPMLLSPVTIDHYVHKGMYEEAEKLNVLNCIECGCCTYDCPAHRKLTQSMRLAKTTIKQRKNAAKADKEA